MPKETVKELKEKIRGVENLNEELRDRLSQMRFKLETIKKIIQ